jgi:serine protease Do
MKRQVPAFFGAVLVGVFTCGCITGPKTSEKSTPAQQLKLVDSLRPSMVTVEVSLKYDQGEAPQRYYDGGSDTQELIRQERPLELMGWLIGPKRVALIDLNLHPRFISSIQVRHGDSVADAQPAGVLTDRPGILLDLSQTLPGAKPLAFNPKAKGPYKVLVRRHDDGDWIEQIQGLSKQTTIRGQTLYHGAKLNGLVMTADGTPVALPLQDRLDVGDAWKAGPEGWASLTQTQYAKAVAANTVRTDGSILRITMNFRSPKGNEERDRSSGSQGGSATEQHALGLVLKDKQTLLVLASFRPKMTARLQRIRVYHGRNILPAKFVGSVKEFGALFVRLEKPLGNNAPTIQLTTEPIQSRRHQMVLKAQIRLAGQQRIAYHSHDRFERYDWGHRRKIYGSLESNDNDAFVFDVEGKLIALPMVRRRKVSVQERWSEKQKELTPTSHVAPLLAEPSKFLDPDNVPLNETQENRIAWMGVVLQPLNRDLARANEVSEQTKDGEIGGLVTYVYQGSPAHKAGIAQGMILVRLHVADQPKPVDIKLEDRWFRFSGVFPWDRLDQFPVEAFDRAPTPWPPAENSFTRKLTDLGFGKKYQAELVIDGKVVRKPMVVTHSPTHYQTAAKYKSESLGMTIRELTFEVRRNLQKKVDDPGVIISRIEPGSSTAVAGIKPFEVITHINKQRVKDVESFKKLVAASGPNLQFSVNRLIRTRQVLIKLNK